jgi:hypothetical protein
MPEEPMFTSSEAGRAALARRRHRAGCRGRPAGTLATEPHLNRPVPRTVVVLPAGEGTPGRYLAGDGRW